MTWHADTGILHRYARGELGDVAAASVEAHVTDCPTCRQLAVSCADDGALTRIKAELDDRLDAPPLTRTQRGLQRVGLDEGDAGLVTGALTLQTSWCAASLLLVCFALMAATLGTDRPTVGLFVALAPLVPLAGVALAYAPRADPTFEIAQASPMPAVRLLLVRAGTVVTLTVPVLVVLSAPFGQLLAFAWLLPALALIGVALAVGTFWPLPTVAATLAGLWIAGATFAISERADADRRCVRPPLRRRPMARPADLRSGRRRVHRSVRHPTSHLRGSPMTSDHHDVELSHVTRRYGARSPSTTSPSAPVRGSPVSSVRTAPARRPSCGSSRPCSAPTSATSRSSGGARRGAPRTATRSGPASATSPRSPASSKGSRCAPSSTTSPCSRRSTTATPAAVRYLGSSSSSASSGRPGARSADCPLERAGASPSPRHCSVGRSC